MSSASSTRTPSSPSAPIASSGCDGTPSLRTRMTSSGARSASRDLRGDRHPAAGEREDDRILGRQARGADRANRRPASRRSSNLIAPHHGTVARREARAVQYGVGVGDLGPPAHEACRGREVEARVRAVGRGRVEARERVLHQVRVALHGRPGHELADDRIARRLRVVPHRGSRDGRSGVERLVHRDARDRRWGTPARAGSPPARCGTRRRRSPRPRARCSDPSRRRARARPAAWSGSGSSRRASGRRARAASSTPRRAGPRARAPGCRRRRRRHPRAARARCPARRPATSPGR